MEISRVAAKSMGAVSRSNSISMPVKSTMPARNRLVATITRFLFIRSTRGATNGVIKTVGSALTPMIIVSHTGEPVNW